MFYLRSRRGLLLLLALSYSARIQLKQVYLRKVSTIKENNLSVTKHSLFFYSHHPTFSAVMQLEPSSCCCTRNNLHQWRRSTFFTLVVTVSLLGKCCLRSLFLNGPIYTDVLIEVLFSWRIYCSVKRYLLPLSTSYVLKHINHHLTAYCWVFVKFHVKYHFARLTTNKAKK